MRSAAPVFDGIYPRMNQQTKIEIRHSPCPHDCPSACALDIEVIGGQTIGRGRGSKQQTYTAGVVCAKVARYAERIHHPERLMYPQRRTGPKGSGQFARMSWDEALDEIAARFNVAEREFGPQSVWPYYYAGTMGLVMRDGINRLAHVKKYSRYYSTICTNIARAGFAIGTGKIAGVDPREMGVSDLIVIWGTNPVNTQVNVMKHAKRARKERGAKIAAIDVYNNDTMKQADIKIILRPGTDGAFACGVMHVLFREGYADRAYMERYTDCPDELEAHLTSRTPEWASSICGVPVGEIEAFARLVGETKRSFFRLGYGFTRSRNGAAQMHAALCIPAVTGAWQYEGGGAFFNNYAIWKFNESLIEGHDAIDHTTRVLDQSQIGRILTGDAVALHGKGPVKAMLIQNTNPMTVAPEQALVRRGLGRRLGAVHPAFEMTPRELIDATLKRSGHGDIATLEADLWRDLQPDFRTSHYLDGFAHADKKFHFKADWAHPPIGIGGMGPWEQMPPLPDHWTIIEEADEAHPFRLATSPSRSFLNTSFNETPSSQAREGAPTVMIHPADAASLGIADGDAVTLGNTRGETTLTAKLFDGLRRGVLIAESIHPNRAHIGGRGINTLTGAEAVAPVGGAAFHDNKVWVKKAAPSAIPAT